MANFVGGSIGGPTKGKKLRDALVPPMGAAGGGQTNWLGGGAKPPGASGNPMAAGGVTSGPGGGDPNYWTADRMKNAKPMGMAQGGGGISPPGGDLLAGGGVTNWLGGSAPGGLGGGGAIGGGKPLGGVTNWKQPPAGGGGLLAPTPDQGNSYPGDPGMASGGGWGASGGSLGAGGGPMPIAYDGNMGGMPGGGQTNWMQPGGLQEMMKTMPALKLLAALFGGGGY